MFLFLFISFVILYIYYWKKEIESFHNEKLQKELKTIRKNINIDVK